MITNISVLGAGTMGHGIASVFARGGYKVNLYDSLPEVREKAVAQIKSELVFMCEQGCLREEQVQATLNKITLCSSLKEAVVAADYVIEATTEDVKLKQELFGQLDKLCRPETILASNTSSIPLQELTADLPSARKQRTMICHWYNPAHLIPLVELSCFGETKAEVFAEVYKLYEKIGKKPVKILKDIPGLIANRMLHALAREVFSLLEMQAASAEDIDKALKFGPGFRSATAGILEAADMGGLDVWCAVEENLFKELSRATSASELMRAKVQEGKLGCKSGEGFFHYPESEKIALKNNFHKRLLVQLQASEKY